VHTLLCRGSGLPIFYLLSPANVHDAPFARPRLQWAVRLYAIRPRIIRLDAAGFRPAAYPLDPCHLACGGGHCLEPQEPEEPLVLAAHVEAREELGKRSSIERFFGRVFLFFHLQRPPLWGWSAIARQVALTYTASIIVGLAAKPAGRPDLIRSRRSCPGSLVGGLMS